MWAGPGSKFCARLLFGPDVDSMIEITVRFGWTWISNACSLMTSLHKRVNREPSMARSTKWVVLGLACLRRPCSGWHLMPISGLGQYVPVFLKSGWAWIWLSLAGLAQIDSNPIVFHCCRNFSYKSLKLTPSNQWRGLSGWGDICPCRSFPLPNHRNSGIGVHTGGPYKLCSRK